MILLSVCIVSVRFPVYIVCPLVLSLNDHKLQETRAVTSIFIQEKSILGLTFNPGLALTGF